jgi:hypothetical protein
MAALALLSAVAVVLWAALVTVAQLVNPDRSALSMGMSGLARGRAPWLMRSAFLARGAAALLLVTALSGERGASGVLHGAAAVAGLCLFGVWGVASAALAFADTDMPGEKPTRAGAAHVLIALVAYVAGTAGAILLSLALRGGDASAGVVRWALPIALAAAVALLVQFAGFGAAAREAEGAAAREAAGAPAPSTAVTAPRRARGIAGYAGLLQRVFIALLMVWTLVVALGL